MSTLNSSVRLFKRSVTNLVQRANLSSKPAKHNISAGIKQNIDDLPLHSGAGDSYGCHGGHHPGTLWLDPGSPGGLQEERLEYRMGGMDHPSLSFLPVYLKEEE
ncbi:unnamed protein product [Lota lota]